MSILKIHAREIFDSRGNPTVEVDLYTSKGEFSFSELNLSCFWPGVLHTCQVVFSIFQGLLGM